jgi:hypothetical protein
MGKSGPNQDYCSRGKLKPPVFPFLSLVSLAVFALSACGIEDYPYLESIPQADVSQNSNDQGRVIIRGSSNGGGNPGPGYFTHYAVYYRLYVGSYEELAPMKNNLYTINPQMSSDYNAIEPYIDNDSIGSSSMGSIFSGRNFYTMVINSDENFLNDSTLNLSGYGKTLIFDFNRSAVPELYFEDNSAHKYPIRRSNGNGSFNPRPSNRYFVNSPDLYDPVNSTPNINADIVKREGLADGDTRHTYIMLYILAIGINLQSFPPIYSTPSTAIILRLPDDPSPGA